MKEIACKLIIDEKLAAPPVTDIMHVCKEINEYRRVLIAMRAGKKKGREYQERHRLKKKINEKL